MIKLFRVAKRFDYQRQQNESKYNRTRLKHPNTTKLQKAVIMSCSICHETLSAEFKLECGHTFHDICIYTWLSTSINASCPCCRQVDVEFLERRLHCFAMATAMTMSTYVDNKEELPFFSLSKIRRNRRIFFDYEFNTALKRNNVYYFWSKYVHDLHTISEARPGGNHAWERFYNVALEKIRRGSNSGLW